MIAAAPTKSMSPLRSFAILCVLTLCMVCLNGPAAAAQRWDGHWWKTLTRDEKVMWAVGFFDGQEYTAELVKGALLIPQADPVTHKWSLERAKVLGDAEDIFDKAIDHDFKNLDAGQLTDGLDKIYEDYRNESIPVVEAVPVVLRSIDGESDEELNQLLERKRKDAAP